MRKYRSFLLMVLLFLCETAFAEGIAGEPIFTKGENGVHTYRIPAIIQTRRGTLLAFAEARQEQGGDSGNIDLVVKRSLDGGKTWGEMITVWDDGENTCGNPAPVIDRQTGRIVLLSTWNDGQDKEIQIQNRESIDTRRVFRFFSDDDGLTWSVPEEITSSVKHDDWTWYATGPGHGIQMQDGRMIVPCDHGDVHGVSTSHIIFSDDGGETWHLGGSPGVGNESTAVELPGGKLMLNMRKSRWDRPDFGNGRLVAISEDRGLSFKAPFEDESLIEPVCEGSILGWTSWRKPTGHLLFSNPESAEARVNMTLRLSKDGGKTWRRVFVLTKGPCAYSDLVVLKGNDVGILYEAGKASRYESIYFARIKARTIRKNWKHPIDPPGKTEPLELTGTERISWAVSQLPPSPSDTAANMGLAGVYAGRINGHLVIAGGANFPEGMPSEGGKKVWHNDVYVQDGDGGWTCYPEALGRASAYGFSVPCEDGLLLIGGCDAGACLDEIRILRLDSDGKPFVESWGSLPVPLAEMAGGVLGGNVFLAGGISSMDEPAALNRFLSLDLKTRTCRELPWMDAPARAFAVGAVQSDGQDNCFYVFSGRDFTGDGPWNVLQDGWAYNPRLGTWKEVEGRFPVMAGVASSYGTNHILFVGGRSMDPDIPDNVLRLYHTVTRSMETLPVEDAVFPVTTTLVRDGNDFIVCSGETAPGIRTPVVLTGKIQSRIKAMGLLDILVILLYFVLLAWIGIHFSKKQKNTDDYFKGGGRIPWFIAGLSIFGTALSAITFMSIPAKAYATDWSYLFFNLGIVLVVPLITLLFIPKFRSLGVTTAYEYLERRFNPFVRVLCSLSFILYQVGRMGIVLLLPSIALNVVTGFNIFFCISLMGILALIYTYMGGIEAVAWTDALQVFVLLGAALAVVLSIAAATPGGFGAIISTASANGKLNLGSTDFDLRRATVWTVLIATVFTNITTYGTDQTIVQRYLTTRTDQQARKGVYTNAILTIPATLLFFFVGTALWVFFKNHPAELSTSVTEPDAILPWYVNCHIPAGALGLVIAGIFAAAMSTISASMNSAATAWVTDIHSKLTARKASTASGLRTAKTATLVIGIVGIAFALMMATWDVKSLWDEFSKILGVLLGGLGGLFLLGFLSRKANSAGAITGLLTSMAVQLFVMHNQSVNLLLYSTVGFLTCFTVGWLVSLLTGGRKSS